MAYVIATTDRGHVGHRVWMALWASTKPLSARDVVFLLVSTVVPCLALWHLNKTWRLFDDRIVIAPDWMLAWKEFGARVEIVRSPAPGEPSTIRVRRYTANCPVCDALVKLSVGEPEFPRRLVGRCE